MDPKRGPCHERNTAWQYSLKSVSREGCCSGLKARDRVPCQRTNSVRAAVASDNRGWSTYRHSTRWLISLYLYQTTYDHGSSYCSENG